MQNLKNKKVKNCLLCHNTKLKSVFNLGNFFISNFVSKDKILRGLKAPLHLLFCNQCELIQLSHIAPQELMYKKFYWYRSGITQTMRDGLKDIFYESLKYVKLTRNDVVVDIGANDGTLLKNYKNKGYVTVGCEPAKNLKNELKKNCNYLINDFWSKKSLDKIIKKNNLKKPKIITAIGMFYDLENPNLFIKDAALSLHEDGVFIAQLMCLNSMLKKNDIGNICHEHIEFYSNNSLKFLFEKNGLEIFKIEENEINGGSYRIFCRKLKNGSINLKKENILENIKQFKKRSESNKLKIINFLKKEIKKQKKIFLYGASTKGNTILQYYKINYKQIPFAAERSKDKYGKYTIGTGIKIIPESIARKLKPDYFFVTPWGFIKEFIKREKKWIDNGGKFIIPFPKLKIIGKK